MMTKYRNQINPLIKSKKPQTIEPKIKSIRKQKSCNIKSKGNRNDTLNVLLGQGATKPAFNVNQQNSRNQKINHIAPSNQMVEKIRPKQASSNWNVVVRTTGHLLS